MLAIGANTLEQAAVFSVTPSSTNAENADYDAEAFPKTITFVAGSGNGTWVTLNTTLDPADDTLVEGDETVTLTLAATSGAATLGGQPANAVTILDADTPRCRSNWRQRQSGKQTGRPTSQPC